MGDIYGTRFYKSCVWVRVRVTEPSLPPSLSLYEMKIYANTYEGGFGL
jgi:hypothetical protein